MKFHIPFTFSSIEKLKRKPKTFKRFIKPTKEDTKLKQYLTTARVGLNREEYLNICFRSASGAFMTIFVIATTILSVMRINKPWLAGFGTAVMFGGFVLFSQLAYPRIYSVRRDRNIEKNLIPALEDMLVQLNSGIPLFNIMVNLSVADYGELSEEFKKIIRKINAGLPQIDVIEEAGEKSSSLFFRRTLWQISNGLKAGSDISVVIRYSIGTLGEEQIIQIQNYGNKLNPLIMFYMLVSIIMPALAITFLTIIASMVNLPSNTTIGMYIGLFVFIVLIQVMFLGVIKSARPSLL